MPYNKQVNPYGIASSELGWKGFADGGKMGNPAALAPPSTDIYRKLAIKAITDIGGSAWNEYTSAENQGQTMWGDELRAFDTAANAEVKGLDGKMRSKNDQELEAAQRAKRDFISSHPNAGKDIYTRPEWTEKIPDFLLQEGSRYKVPEGSVNQRQASSLRNNWRASPSFVPEGAPLAKKKGTTPLPPVNANAPLVIDPTKSGWNQLNQKKDLQERLKKGYYAQEESFPNWWELDYFQDEAKLEANKKHNAAAKWLGGRGAIGSADSPARKHFMDEKNRGALKAYDDDAQAYFNKYIYPTLK